MSSESPLMTITEKDRIFLALLPALAVAAAYFLWVARPASKQADRLASRLAALGSEQDILSRRARLAADQARLKAKLAAAEAQASAAPAEKDAVPADAASVLSQLQEMAARNRVRVVSAALAAGHSNAKNSEAQEALLKAGAPQPRVWAVTLEATYEALAQLLGEFGRSRFPIIPETLSMHPGAEAGKPCYWTLNVCL